MSCSWGYAKIVGDLDDRILNEEHRDKSDRDLVACGMFLC